MTVRMRQAFVGEVEAYGSCFKMSADDLREYLNMMLLLGWVD